MKQMLFSLLLAAVGGTVAAQTNPAITSWIVNSTGIRGRHYISGSSTVVNDTAKANVQLVQYSTTAAYIRCSGIPSYIVGPYLDGNPSLATDRNWLFKIPLTPTRNTGTPTNVGLGQMGVFKNGVPMYNYADGMSYNNLGIWHRDAIYFERKGFDCAKGHPSPVFSGGMPGSGPVIGGSYHHHQNPSAFKLDKVVISNVCDLYLADGIYVMDSTTHSPLLGFAFDGYPVYGAYAYANSDGTGGIKRIKSSFQKRAITVRTVLPDGTSLSAANYGPAVSDSFPLGCYMEDYNYVAGSGDLDEHNGRFAKTPEYPSGTYAYYTTVDSNQNSFYPYIIGPSYYGIVERANFGMLSTSVTITESVTTYTPTAVNEVAMQASDISLFPNPASDLIAVQLQTVMHNPVEVKLMDMTGRCLNNTTIYPGSTIGYIDVRRLYNGNYTVVVSAANTSHAYKVLIER
jgi:hypothetical protein